MGDNETTKAAVEQSPATEERSEANALLMGSLGWLIPGLGHLLQKKFDRAGVFFVSIVTLAGLGLAMGAKLYTPPFENSQGLFLTVLHVLGFLGELGAGALYLGAAFAGLGANYLGQAGGDYGTVFLLCAGLLNLLTALDAYDVAVGKKG